MDVCLPHTRFSRLFFAFYNSSRSASCGRVLVSRLDAPGPGSCLLYNLFSIMCKSHDTHCFSISRAGSIASSSKRHGGDPPSTRPVVARRRALKPAKAVCSCAPPSQPLEPRIDGVFTPDAWHGFCAGTSAQANLMGRAAYVPVRLHLQLFLQICGRAALCAQCRGRHLGNHCP